MVSTFALLHAFVFSEHFQGPAEGGRNDPESFLFVAMISSYLPIPFYFLNPCLSVLIRG